MFFENRPISHTILYEQIVNFSFSYWRFFSSYGKI